MPMVNLYYVSRQAARLDCDFLGISRLRLRTVRDKTLVFAEDGKAYWVPVVAMLRVSPDLIEKVGGPDALHNDDSEETW